MWLCKGSNVTSDSEIQHPSPPWRQGQKGIHPIKTKYVGWRSDGTDGAVDEGSYLRQTSAKDLAMAKKEKTDKYLQHCLELRNSFTLMVYSADVFYGTEAVAAQRRLASLISNNLK